MDDTEVINFLLSTEIIPLCLRTMEMGSELSKTVSTLLHGCSLNIVTSSKHSRKLVGRFMISFVDTNC